MNVVSGWSSRPPIRQASSGALDLTTKQLKSLLDAGRLGRKLPETGLKETIGFEIACGGRRALMSRDAQDYHLLEWLNHLIRSSLGEQREFHHLKTPNLNGRHEDLGTLAGDFRQSSKELEAWSVLYYYFVRVDFDLSLQQLAIMAATTERTLRRRQNRGLYRLLATILELERDLRRFGLQVVAVGS